MRLDYLAELQKRPDQFTVGGMGLGEKGGREGGRGGYTNEEDFKTSVLFIWVMTLMTKECFTGSLMC